MSHDINAPISQLFIYPIKSCAGIAVAQAVLTAHGLQWDRHWMVVKDAKGDASAAVTHAADAAEFVTQRELPRMALVQPELTADALVLHAPGMASLTLPLHGKSGDAATRVVKVWKDTLPAFDAGAGAARWLSDFLGQPLRLVRFDPAQLRASSPTWTRGEAAHTHFADGFALLVVSQASLDLLNHKLVAAGHQAVSMARFRPNIVVTGLEAHDEDRLDTLHITTAQGTAQLLPVKPCPRCPIPNIDPVTAHSSPEVSDMLQTYQQNPLVGGAVTFGQNAIVLSGTGHLLEVGQSMAAGYRFE